MAITLSENEREYLLRIPANQRERAKGIPGRRWDVKRKVWYWPRTLETYRGLVAEFGEESSIESISAPTADKPEVVSLDKQNARLRAEITELQKTVQKLKQTLDQDPGKNRETVLTKALAEKDKELSGCLLRREEIEQTVKHLSVQNDSVKVENERLNDEIVRLRKRLVGHDPPSTSESTQDVAAEAAGHDPKFLELIQVRKGEVPQIGIMNRVERILRKRMGVPLRGREPTFFTLIEEARESELLGEAAVEMAHIIRQQRNKAAHDITNPQESVARAHMVILAAACLWPSLK